MGNAFSSGNNILVQLDKPAYYPGEQVKGVVALNCIQDINTTGIELEVTGFEQSNFTANTSDSSMDDGMHDTMHHHGRKDFFKVTVPLGPPGNLPAGQYQFGFQFVLPQNLPGSFYHARGGDSGRIVYTAKAVAHTPGFNFSISGQQDITIHQRVPATHGLTNSVNSGVNSFCCISKGSVSLQATIPKDAITGGEPVVVVVQCRNNSTARFDRLDLKVRRKILLTTASSGYNRQQWSEEIANVSSQGIGPNEVAEASTARQIQFALPIDTCPTTNGTCVHCTYSIEVVLHNDSMFTSNVSCPIMGAVVNTGPPPGDQSTVFYNNPPLDWKPSKVFNDVDVTVPECMPSAPPMGMPSVGGGQNVYGGQGQVQYGQAQVHYQPGPQAGGYPPAVQY